MLHGKFTVLCIFNRNDPAVASEINIIIAGNQPFLGTDAIYLGHDVGIDFKGLAHDTQENKQISCFCLIIFQQILIR